MPIFKPKKGPVVRWSRGLHAMWGATGVQLGSIIGKKIGGKEGAKKGAAWGGAAVVVGGFAWEVSNHYTGGYHQYGDGFDFLAFVGGVLLTGGLRSLLKRKKVI